MNNEGFLRVTLPEDVPKDKTLEYIRSLLPTRSQREMFDYFIDNGVLQLKEEDDE